MARAKATPLAYRDALASIDAALARLAALDSGASVTEHHAALQRHCDELTEQLRSSSEKLRRWSERPGAQTIELQLREEIAGLQRQLADARAAAGDGVFAGDHDGLCWRAFRDALVCTPGATEIEGASADDPGQRVGALDHPLGETVCAVLRSGADDLGAVHASQVIASELHALARDAAAWRRIREMIAGDLHANASDRDSIAEYVWREIEREETAQWRAEQDRTRSRRERAQLHPWAAWNASDLGRALADAFARGITDAQEIADKDANAIDKAAEAELDKPAEHEDHAVWWRAFVATACGSVHADGDARRLAWAMRRAGLHPTATDDSIETVEACAEALGALLDRGVGRVA